MTDRERPELPPSARDRDPTGARFLSGPDRRPERPLPEPASPDQLPADPQAYDSPRASQARARGLSAPYIAGGEDPNPEQGRREERRMLRLLVAMIVILVLAGFVLGVLENLLAS